MQVVSVNIAKPTQVIYNNKKITTGIYKKAVNHIFLQENGVENDAVIDKKHHGGINQAVYAYGYNHYNYWQELYPYKRLPYGTFGENITIDFLNETTIKIGTVYKIGEALVQVTKPRKPCSKLGIVFNTQKIVKQFLETNKCGLYFKVLQGGKIKVGDEITLLREINTNPTIAQIYCCKNSN